MTGRSLFRSRHWRLLRWAGLAPAVAALWACSARSLEAPKVLPGPVYQQKFQESVNRNVDILFVIDNSSSMTPAQNALDANYGRFTSVLENLRDGLPNIHMAVISSDMGAGNGVITACGGNGNAGQFQFSPKTPCTDTTLNGATFIVNDNGVANYTSSLTDTFRCIAKIGDTGCGFEQHLLSLSRSLGADGYAPPAENANFLRDDAYLAVIIIANEDDCSARGGASDMLFNSDQRLLGTTLGPVGSFRCNEFGHTCSQGAPSRHAPNDQLTDMVTYSECRSNEDSAYLKPVAAFVDEIKRLKPDPATQILVASIVGVPTMYNGGAIPYTVGWQTSTIPDTDGPWPIIQPACNGNQGGTAYGADPAVRLVEFTRAFGDNGLVYSICENDFGPSLQLIAEKLSQLLGPKCISGTLADHDGNPNDRGSITPECTVMDHFTKPGGGGTIDTVVPQCDANNQPTPCWRLQPGNLATNMCNPDTFVMDIQRGDTEAPFNSTVSCALCAPGVNNGRTCANPIDPFCPCQNP